MVHEEHAFIMALKALREAHDLSRRQASHRCGLHGEAWSLYELGKRTPLLQTVRTILTTLAGDVTLSKDLWVRYQALPVRTTSPQKRAESVADWGELDAWLAVLRGDGMPARGLDRHPTKCPIFRETDHYPAQPPCAVRHY